MIFEGKKNADKWFPVRLVDSVNLNTPETGIAFGSVVCKYGYEGAIAESVYAVTTNDWKEQGDGNYWLQIGVSEFTGEGKYILKVEATGCADYNFVVEARDMTIAELMDICTEARLARLDATISSRSSHSAANVATEILVTPANKIANNASGVIDANMVQLGGVIQSLTDLKDFADAGYDPSAHKVEGVKLVDTTATNSDMATGFATPTNVSDTQALIITQVNENEVKLDAMQGNVTSILSNTNEVHGLITSDKIAAQVKGLDADVLTASALATDAVTEIATAIMAKTVDGSIDVTKALNMMVALLAGDMTKTDNTYTFKDQSGVVVFTALMSSTERNGTVA